MKTTMDFKFQPLETSTRFTFPLKVTEIESLSIFSTIYYSSFAKSHKIYTSLLNQYFYQSTQKLKLNMNNYYNYI